jgi:hypothetical protein
MVLPKFDDDIYDGLPAAHVDFDAMYDVKETKTKYTKGLRTAMTNEMYQCIQDLLANKSLPFGGDTGMFGRHVWGAGIESLKSYLSPEARSHWAALQGIQRRLTAERYVITIEEQVKEAADLLASWTSGQEWDAIAADFDFILGQLEAFPQAAWRRRVAREWMGNEQIQAMMELWAEDMAPANPDAWERVVKVWHKLEGVANG